jgi:hypothetical protein
MTGPTGSASGTCNNEAKSHRLSQWNLLVVMIVEREGDNKKECNKRSVLKLHLK